LVQNPLLGLTFKEIISILIMKFVERGKDFSVGQFVALFSISPNPVKDRRGGNAAATGFP
jgi:hypothetical protein